MFYADKEHTAIYLRISRHSLHNPFHSILILDFGFCLTVGLRVVYCLRRVSQGNTEEPILGVNPHYAVGQPWRPLKEHPMLFQVSARIRQLTPEAIKGGRKMKRMNRAIVSMLTVLMLSAGLFAPANAAASGAPAKYEQVLNAVATAYAPGPHDNGKWGNLTHIGTQVRPGIIAVDPRVIPLKSKVYIEFPDGHGVHAIAEDTGGAIKGNRIDIAMWTVAEAYDFGMKNVKVYVLK